MNRLSFLASDIGKFALAAALMAGVCVSYAAIANAQGTRSGVTCVANAPIYGNTYSLDRPEGGVTCSEGGSGGGGGGGGGGAVRRPLPTTVTPIPGGSGIGFQNVIHIDNDADHASIYDSRTDTSTVLIGGGQDLASATYAFPSAGTWYLRACADDLNTVSEESELNNCGPWTTITVTAPAPALLPDLTASNIEALPIANSLNVIFNATIRNIGAARAGN